ncbi:hypothetical protein JTE90_022433 [Oedothorax gibbosus]|uniref:Uncharacterized protein n=1 Tax=Oedothorax gibbosus TaxID=931172 RepID=A0AAV6TRA7_9ARAC|nr:hypothetical protein JTE90_022433 [Oedothorax gibbosus]
MWHWSCGICWGLGEFRPKVLYLFLVWRVGMGCLVVPHGERSLRSSCLGLRGWCVREGGPCLGGACQVNDISSRSGGGRQREEFYNSLKSVGELDVDLMGPGGRLLVLIDVSSRGYEGWRWFEKQGGSHCGW